MKLDQLEQCLAGLSVDADCAKTYLRWMDFPPEELELDKVQDLLTPFIEACSRLQSIYKLKIIAPEWHAIAKKISEIVIPVEKEAKKSNLPALWGEYEKHPMYIALQFCPCGYEQSVYLDLLAHIQLARTLIANKTNGYPEYKNVLSTAPASLRKVSQPPYLTLLGSIKTNCIPQQLAVNIAVSQLAEELAPVCTLLGYWGGKKAPSRDGIRRFSRSETAPKIKQVSRLLGEENNDTPQLMVINQKTPADAEDRMLAKDEIAHAPDFVILTEAEATNKLQTLMQGMARTQRAALTSLQNRNQCLPYAWESLCVHEIVELWVAIQNLHKQDQVLASFLALILATGQDAVTVCGFALYTAETVPTEPKVGLVSRDGNWAWINIPYTPNVGKPSSFLQVIPTEGYIQLDLPAPVQSMLSVKNVTAIKRSSPDELLDKAQDFISGVNNKKQLRLTLDRISHFLRTALLQEQRADVTTSMLITGQAAYTGTVASHYTAQQIHRLNSIYHNTWQKVLGHSQPPSDVEISPNTLAGSTRIPRADVLRKLIEQLFEAAVVRQIEAERTNTVITSIRYHNAFTRYVAIMVAYSTGVRAVSSPMPHLSDIDMTTGFYVLRDKDSSDGYHTRLMWLHPMCLEQLLHYWSHARELVNRLSVLQPDFFVRVRAKRTRQIENEIFFMTAEGEPEEITPKVLHDFSNLPGAVYLPDNAHRHLLRSWLLEQNCPPEIINAFLGHWSLGEEPWGRYSGLSPQIFKGTLSEYLPHLMDQLGFRVFNPSSNQGE